MGCLEFEVIPEVSLRNEHVEFMLGMPLCQTITALQNAARHIRNIELTYSDKDPLSRDITITLANDGIRLVFDARCQQLKLIEVYDLSHIALRYCSSFISKPTDQATVAKIESSFGATHPGVYDKKLKVYTLSWRGLSFCFSTPNDVAPSQQSPFAHGLGSLQFPNGSSPVVAKMYIFNGATLADARVVDVPIECYGGNNRLQSVGTVKSNGTISAVVFNFSAETTRTQSCLTNSIGTYTRTVSFGDTEDSVLSALGSPSRVFLKSEDKMRIHRPSGDRIRELDGTDFFFNYFSMGVINCAVPQYNETDHSPRKKALNTHW
uniref:Uncharacterized protein n=1 Tax=Plectus sambesii TaxID=2011161 RepID=A0A914VF01_9BILA